MNKKWIIFKSKEKYVAQQRVYLAKKKLIWRNRGAFKSDHLVMRSANRLNTFDSGHKFAELRIVFFWLTFPQFWQRISGKNIIHFFGMVRDVTSFCTFRWHNWITNKQYLKRTINKFFLRLNVISSNILLYK